MQGGARACDRLLLMPWLSPQQRWLGALVSALHPIPLLNRGESEHGETSMYSDSLSLYSCFSPSYAFLHNVWSCNLHPIHSTLLKQKACSQLEDAANLHDDCEGKCECPLVMHSRLPLIWPRSRRESSRSPRCPMPEHAEHHASFRSQASIAP